MIVSLRLLTRTQRGGNLAATTLEGLKMNVQTTGLMTGVRIQFELSDLSKYDQIELLIMSLRGLGLDKSLGEEVMSKIDKAIAEIPQS